MRVIYGYVVRNVLDFTQGFWKSQEIHPYVKQTYTALGPLILTVSLGMTSGFSAILLPQLQSNRTEIAIENERASWIASIAALPMAFGCILGGIIMEYFGRKSAHLITTIPCTIGWITLYIATDFKTILIGRFLTGICGGLLGPSTGVYISETSSPKFRGFLLAAISAAMAIGLFFVHFLGTFFHWRTTALLSAFLPLLSLILMIFAPESPAWLLRKGDRQRGEYNFYWCKGFSEETNKEFCAIIQKNDDKCDLKDFLKPQFFKPLFIISVFIVANQWSGVNAITFYTITIMRNILGRNFNEYFAMLLVDAIRVVMSIGACLALKKMRRRILAIISGVGTFLALFILSLFTYSSKTWPFMGGFTIIPIISLVAYISFITIGFVPLPWAMMGEVFPLKQRNIGSSICAFMGFGAFFTVVKTNPSMLESFGTDGTFLVYGFVAMFGTVFIYFFLPETKDKPLYEIEKDFHKKEDTKL